jgi:hypothetical protein
MASMRLIHSLLLLVFVSVSASAQAAPMRIAVFVDNGAATGAALPQVRAGLAAFLDALPPEHEVALITTGRRSQVRVPPTIDRAKLKGSAGGLLAENGPNALIDSLLEIEQRFLRKPGERWPVIVIITGTGSENSKDNDDQAFNRWLADLAHRGVSANAIVLKTAGGTLPELIATTMVKATSGHYAVMSNGEGMAPALTQLAGELALDASKRP